MISINVEVAKDMDVVLIQPCPGGSGINDATVLPPLGLASIAAFLEQRGYSCRIIDAYLDKLADDDVIRMIGENTRMVGVSMNSFTYGAACRLAQEVLQELHCMVVLGGPVPTAVPEQVLRDVPGVVVVMGEGEFPMASIMENLLSGRAGIFGEIPGVARLDEVGVFRQTPPDRIGDLDALPFPAYHLLPPLNRYRSRSRRTPVGGVITSRGCAFACSFCSKDVFRRKVTWRSAANVLAEIDLLVRDHGIRQLDILDDNIALDRDRLETIMDGLLERDYRLVINLQTGIRTETLDEPLLRKMRRAGVFKLAFGIESADPQLLERHGKGLDLAKVEQVTLLANRLGFVVYGFFIIGLPGETDESFARTIAFAKRCRFDVANFCMAIPFVGTDLHRMVAEGGKFLVDTIRNIPSGFYAGRVFFEYGDMSEATVLERYRRAYREYYTISRMAAALIGIRSFAELRWLWQARSSVRYGL